MSIGTPALQKRRETLAVRSFWSFCKNLFISCNINVWSMYCFSYIWQKNIVCSWSELCHSRHRML